MGQISQYLYNWINPITGQPVPNTEFDGKTLVDGFDFTKNPIVKLGIKAPPGTRFLINGNVFTINPSGMLNINKPGYEITSLKLLLEKKLEIDEEAQKKLREKGICNMDEALSTLLNSNLPLINLSVETDASAVNVTPKITITTNQEDLGLKTINGNLTIVSPSNIAIGTISNFIRDFTQGYNEFIQSVEGIYKVALDTNNNPITEEVSNVIVDFEQKEANNI